MSESNSIDSVVDLCVMCSLFFFSKVWIMIAVEIVGATVFAYCVGALITIIVNWGSAHDKDQEQSLQVMNEYLGGMRTSRPFRSALRMNALHRAKTKALNEDEVLSALPPALRIAVVAHTRGRGLAQQAPSLCEVMLVLNLYPHPNLHPNPNPHPNLYPHVEGGGPAPRRVHCASASSQALRLFPPRCRH